MARVDVLRRFDDAPPARADGACAVFTGSGIRPCRTSEPLGWALLRLAGLRPQWCWSAHDLTFPVVLRDELRTLPAIADHAWVEVLRYGVPAAPTRHHGLGCDGGGYGTWFYVAPGSGVKVNVGRLLTFVTREAAVASALRERAAANATLPCEAWSEREARGPSCAAHADSHLCAAARRLGADSVFIEGVDYGADALAWRGRRQELILCTQQSATPQCRACPAAVDLRRANGTRHVCGPEWRLPPVAPGVAPLRGLTCDRTACAQGVAGAVAAAVLGAVLVALAPRPRSARRARAYRAFHAQERDRDEGRDARGRGRDEGRDARGRGRDDEGRDARGRGRDEGRDEGARPARQRRCAALACAILTVGSGVGGAFLTACAS